MKKFSKYIVLSLILFLISINNVFATETKTDLKTLGDMVNETDGSKSFYIIGKYIFTAKYIRENSLSLQDIMLAARSIDLLGGDGETNKTDAYKKMSIQTVSAIQDRTGAITGWKFGSNLIGDNTLSNDEILDIKYIGYKPTEEVFTVTFKDDQKEVAKQYIIKGHKAVAEKLEPKEGYDFKGWFKCTSAEDCSNVDAAGEQFNFNDTTITENITLKAKWEIHKFTVTIDNDNNEVEKTEQVEYKGKVSKPESNPIKEGYDFIDWFKCTSTTNCDNVATASEPFNFDSTEITEDIKIKAKWKIHKYSVTFDLGEGQGTANKQEIPYKKHVSMPANPTREGYKFLGWFKCTDTNSCDNVQDIIDDDTEPGNAFDFNNTEITEDMKLKAKWKQIKHKVIFKAKVDGEEKFDILEGDTEIILTYPYKLLENQIPKIKDAEGYDFIKWADDKGSIDVITNRNFTADETTVTGEWQTKKFTILFKNFDKTNYRAFGVNYNDPIPEGSYDSLDRPCNIKYNSYKFLGWFKCNDDNCKDTEQDAFDFKQNGHNVKENMTFIAKYDQIINTTEIMSNFTEQLKSEDFSAYVSGKNITFNILKPTTNLQTNFDKFVVAMLQVIAVDNVKVEISYDGQSDEQPKTLDSGNAQTELKNLITTLSKENDLTSSNFEKLDNKSFTIKLTLDEDIKNLDNDNSVTYTVSFNTEGFVYVDSFEKLKNNLSSNEEIIISKPFDITELITINGNVTIDGNGQTLTSTITNEKYTFDIMSGNVTIKDLTLIIDTLLPSEYNKKEQKSKIETIKNTIGFKVESDANLTITNVTVNGNKTVNTEALTINGEPYNSTNVVINENAAIELYGTLSGSGLTYTSEIYGSPAVLSHAVPAGDDQYKYNEVAKMNLGHMNRQTYVFNIKERKDTSTESHDVYDRVTDFVHYYGNYENSYATIVLYIYDRYMLPFFYIYNEKLIEPKIFGEDGTYNTDGDGKNFTGWSINSKSVSREELKNRTIENGNGINVVAQYK